MFLPVKFGFHLWPYLKISSENRMRRENSSAADTHNTKAMGKFFFHIITEMLFVLSQTVTITTCNFSYT